MDALATSLKKLDGIINRKLSSLSEKTSPSELTELHDFLKQARELKQTIQAIDEPEDELFMEEVDDDSEAEFDLTTEEYEDDFIEFFVDGCRLIKTLYALLDDHKIKETDCHWVFEETRNYLERARESVGSRVPELPIMRVVSKKRENKEPKPKTSKK